MATRAIQNSLQRLCTEGYLIRADYTGKGLGKHSGRTVLYGVGKQFDSLCERIRQNENFVQEHINRHGQ